MNAQTNCEFRLPNAVYFGAGVSDRVGTEARALGGTRALIITDENLRRLGYPERARQALAAEGIVAAIYAGVNGEPTVDHVGEGLAALRSAQADLVVAVGGGSPIDTAKAVAAVAVNGGRIADYLGQNKVPRPGLPVIAMPTTAGTGSEVTRFDIITDPATSVKMLIGSPHMVPRVALVDPTLTVTVPADVTAATGVDALTHAIEAYVSRRASPISDPLALSAIRLIADNLAAAHARGDDLAARAAMAMGSLQAGMAFTNSSVALVHGMARPLGAYFGIRHGVSNAALLAAVVRFSLPGALERYRDVAVAMGEHARDLPVGEAAGLAAQAIERLGKGLAIPTLQGLGIAKERLAAVVETMARDAIASGSPANNPQPATADEIVALYWQAF